MNSLPGCHWTLNCFCSMLSTSYHNLILNALLCFLFICWFIILNAVLLSVQIGIVCCLWPSSSRIVMKGTMCCELIYSNPHSASASDAITAFIIFISM